MLMSVAAIWSRADEIARRTTMLRACAAWGIDRYTFWMKNSTEKKPLTMWYVYFVLFACRPHVHQICYDASRSLCDRGLSSHKFFFLGLWKTREMNFNPKCDIRVHISNSFVISSRCGKYWKRFIGAPLELARSGKVKNYYFFFDRSWMEVKYEKGEKQ